MFDHLKEYNIYIKPGFTDMRKRADNLSLLVRSEMGMDPREKSIFIFCGRDKRRVTAIVWDSNGWLEFSKRLSCFGMSFKWPSTEKEAMSVTIADMEEMLRGGDPWRRFPEF